MGVRANHILNQQRPKIFTPIAIAKLRCYCYERSRKDISSSVDVLFSDRTYRSLALRSIVLKFLR